MFGNLRRFRRGHNHDNWAVFHLEQGADAAAIPQGLTYYEVSGAVTPGEYRVYAAIQ
jgi:hypothetical protein